MARGEITRGVPAGMLRWVVDTNSPETLVRWCQQTLPDDSRGFEQLVAQYKGQVFATALRLMGTPEDAEDVAQDVFLKVYKSIDQLDEPAALGAWLTRITINTSLSSLKRQRRLRTDSFSQWPDGDIDERFALLGTLPGPETLALAHELRACIEATLQQLGDAERVVLLMRDVEGCSYQEISDILRLNLGAAKMRIRRTRLAFQRLFQRICPDVWQPTSFAE